MVTNVSHNLSFLFHCAYFFSHADIFYLYVVKMTILLLHTQKGLAY